MPARSLREFLDANSVKYVTLAHSPAYTAQEIAAAAHVGGYEMAKTVVVKLDGKLALAVLTAAEKLDLHALEEITGARHASLATEAEFGHAFPGCELGAMPPFGNLYGMEVFVSPRLAADREIAFNAGSHTELIRLAYRDFERLVRPKIVQIAGSR